MFFLDVSQAPCHAVLGLAPPPCFPGGFALLGALQPLTHPKKLSFKIMLTNLTRILLTKLRLSIEIEIGIENRNTRLLIIFGCVVGVGVGFVHNDSPSGPARSALRLLLAYRLCVPSVAFSTGPKTYKLTECRREARISYLMACVRWEDQA